MVPKLKAESFPGWIDSSIVYVREKDIITIMNYCDITAMSCGCPVEQNKVDSKRKEIKNLIANLKKQYKNIEMNIYKSAQNVNLDRLLGYKLNNRKHFFLDWYDESND